MGLLIKHLKNDEDAELFLKNVGLLKTKEKCPYCGSTEYYAIRRNHYKCKSCRREWSKYKGSIFENFRIKPLKFLKILEALSEGTVLKKISKDLNVSYNTVLKVRNLIREHVLKNILNVEEIGETVFIGVNHINHKINLEYLEMIDFSLIKDNKVGKLGRIYFIHDYKHYELLIVISENTIPELDEKSHELLLARFKKELRTFIDDFTNKVSSRKLVNNKTILYSIFLSLYINDKKALHEIIFNAFQSYKK